MKEKIRGSKLHQPQERERLSLESQQEIKIVTAFVERVQERAKGYMKSSSGQTYWRDAVLDELYALSPLANQWGKPHGQA